VLTSPGTESGLFIRAASFAITYASDLIVVFVAAFTVPSALTSIFMINVFPRAASRSISLIPIRFP